jgi:uncharacterized protein YdhG (YjbR/CyaY superfamily)
VIGKASQHAAEPSRRASEGGMHQIFRRTLGQTYDPAMTDPRVDAYIASRPPEQQDMLQRLRDDVARLAPDAVETISYDMPAFKLEGRFLLSFAGWKRHCTVYPINDGLLTRHAAVLEGYTSTKGGLHFTAAKPLPAALVDDLVRGRIDDVHRSRN